MEIQAQRFAAVKKWKSGGETVMDCFGTQNEAIAWIRRQKRPRHDEFKWCVGEFATVVDEK